MQLWMSGRGRVPARRAATALACALVAALMLTTVASAAKAIIITKKTDQSTPELFSNFAPTASLAADGHTVHVAGTVDCEGPTADAVPVQIWVMVWKDGVAATGTASSACTGTAQAWSADVVVRGAGVLTAGTAHAHAWVGVAPEAGGGPSAFDWGRLITLGS